MRTSPRRSQFVLIPAIAIGAGALVGLALWPEPHRIVAFCCLILAAIAASADTMRQASVPYGALILPSFVINFTSLLFFGPHATLLVATAGAVFPWLADTQRSRPRHGMLLD